MRSDVASESFEIMKNMHFPLNAQIVVRDLSLMLWLGVIKMLMTDGFENKVIQLLFGIFFAIIVYFAWCSTNVTQRTNYPTIFLVNRHIRRRNRSRLTTHIQSTSIVEATQTGETSETTESNQSSEGTQNSSKPPEASTSNTDNSRDTGSQNQIENEEIQTIFQIMDADTNVVRLRRLAYYENREENSNTATSSTEERDEVSTESSEISEEAVNPNEPIMEHNYALHESRAANDDVTPKTEEDIPKSEEDPSKIRIKLKFLNDDLKLVDGRLDERLGDFKRRHFTVEYSSNKVVKLIFNGQVLQSDLDTLASCGLFHNCVVHCLVHQPRNNSNDSAGGGGGINADAGGGTPSHNRRSRNAREEAREWDLGNVFFGLVSIFLGSAWYFRYEFAHMYNVTATVGLVFITVMFTIVLIAIYLPESENGQPRVVT